MKHAAGPIGRLIKKATLALIIALFAASPAWSAYDESLPNAGQEVRARALFRELRCVVCQGQSIDESNAPLASDLRALVREQIAAGASDDEIKEFVVARYGTFVLMRPPLRGDTFALWFAPLLLLVIGAGVVGVVVTRSRRRAGELSADAHGAASGPTAGP